MHYALGKFDKEIAIYQYLDFFIEEIVRTLVSSHNTHVDVDTGLEVLFFVAVAFTERHGLVECIKQGRAIVPQW